jgi:hypothetical protein
MRTVALLMLAALVGGWHVDCPCPADPPQVCAVCVDNADTCSAHHGGEECVATRATPPLIPGVAVLPQLCPLLQSRVQVAHLLPLTAAPLRRGPVLGTPSDRAPPVSKLL